MTDLSQILSNFNTLKGVSCHTTRFQNREDGSNYDVWLIDADGRRVVLKKAKGYELEIYERFLSIASVGVPEFIESTKHGDNKYFLTEYVEGNDLCVCDRASLIKVLDALIALQDRFWSDTSRLDVGHSLQKSLDGRINRGKYLCDPRIEKAYELYLSLYQHLPLTLCHDDLLPFNVIVNSSHAAIIDWEYAGMLPYPTSLVRLISHSEEDGGAFFYIQNEDKAFAVEYYYENLVRKKGISRADYERDVHMFMLYEYCEWIYLGNKYKSDDKTMLEKYFQKAHSHLDAIGFEF